MQKNNEYFDKYKNVIKKVCQMIYGEEPGKTSKSFNYIDPKCEFVRIGGTVFEEQGANLCYAVAKQNLWFSKELANGFKYYNLITDDEYEPFVWFDKYTEAISEAHDNAFANDSSKPELIFMFPTLNLLSKKMNIEIDGKIYDSQGVELCNTLKADGQSKFADELAKSFKSRGLISENEYTC